MKKIIILCLYLMSSYSYALQVIENNNSIVEPVIPNINESIEVINKTFINKSENEKLITKAGRIIVFDRTNNIAIIGKNSYRFSREFNLYGGEAYKGNFVRFNIDKNNELIDMWILKR